MTIPIIFMFLYNGPMKIKLGHEVVRFSYSSVHFLGINDKIKYNYVTTYNFTKIMLLGSIKFFVIF